MNLRGSAMILLATAALMSFACRDKSSVPDPVDSPAEVSGLQAIPASAAVVVGIDVAALADVWLVERAVGQMFARDPGLKDRLTLLTGNCEVDLKRDVRSLVLGLGQGAESGQALMVATGKFAEASIAACIRQSLETDGDTLVVSKKHGRIIYHAKRDSELENSVWFAFGDARTLLVATSDAWLSRALDTEERKIASSPELMGWIQRARKTKKRGIWAAGKVVAETGQDMVNASGGAVGAPPIALFGHLDVSKGWDMELAAVMGSQEDANALAALAKDQLSVGALLVQRYGVGPFLSKVVVDADGDTVYLRMSLGESELKDALARIDTNAELDQDSQPDSAARSAGSAGETRTTPGSTQAADDEAPQ